MFARYLSSLPNSKSRELTEIEHRQVNIAADMDRVFHTKEPPHGMRNFDLGTFSATQKKLLNRRKQLIQTENEKYLATHPEIKGLVSILLREILKEQPNSRIKQFVGELFNAPRHKIVYQLLLNYNRQL